MIDRQTMQEDLTFDWFKHFLHTFEVSKKIVQASEAMQGGMMLPFITDNERFKRVRKLVTHEMRPSVSVEDKRDTKLMILSY